LLLSLALSDDAVKLCKYTCIPPGGFTRGQSGYSCPTEKSGEKGMFFLEGEVLKGSNLETHLLTWVPYFSEQGIAHRSVQQYNMLVIMLYILIVSCNISDSPSTVRDDDII
jgi:hypothetical protein